MKSDAQIAQEMDFAELQRVNWQVMLQVVIGAALLALLLYWLHWLREHPDLYDKASSRSTELSRNVPRSEKQTVAAATGGVVICEQPASTLPIFKNTLDFVRHEAHIHDWICAQCERFGGRPWTFRVLGRPPAIVFSDPSAVEDILKTQFWNFEKGADLHETLFDLVGDGVFAVDGDDWVLQRKTASHLFTHRELRETMAAVVQQHTTRLCEVLDQYAATSQPFDLFALLNRFTMGAFCDIGFGVDIDCLGDGDAHPFQVAFDRVQQAVRLRMNRPRWFWKLQRFLNMGAEATLRSDMPVIDDMVYKIIRDSLQQRGSNASAQDHHQQQHSESPTRAQKTIVSLFLDDPVKVSGQSAARQVDSKFLRDIVMGFLLAGRDTTAQTMSWLFLCLSENPHVEAKVRQELATKLATNCVDDPVQVPTLDQVQNLVYLDAVLHETLRLYPPVAFNWKIAVRDSVLSDGTLVPEGTYAAFPSYAIGRMTSVWGRDAKQFKPERWIDPETGNVRKESPFKFLAFHAGPRSCLGRNLALMELKIVVATLLSRFQFQIATRAEDEVKYGVSLTFPLNSPLRARVARTYVRP